jgi:hypothetical protein
MNRAALRAIVVDSPTLPAVEHRPPEASMTDDPVPSPAPEIESAEHDVLAALAVLHYSAIDLAEGETPLTRQALEEAARQYLAAVRGLRTRAGDGYRLCLGRESDMAVFAMDFRLTEGIAKAD